MHYNLAPFSSKVYKSDIIELVVHCTATVHCKSEVVAYSGNGSLFLNCEAWKLKLRQDCINQIFKPNTLFFSVLRGTWYLHAIFIEFIYFASFTGYEDDMSNFRVQRSKFCRKI